MLDLIHLFPAFLGTFGFTAAALGASAATATAVGLGGAGLATNLIGQNQQRVANDRATRENQAALTGQNNSAWTNWLMSRGIAPTTPVAAGVMPQAGQYKAVNTKLPLWATTRTPGKIAPRRILGVPSSAPQTQVPLAVKPLPVAPPPRVME